MDASIMKNQSPNPDPSWEMLRKAWVSTSPVTHSRLESTQKMQDLWAAEARRLRWITLGDWMLALAMAGILSAMALQVTEAAGRFLLALSALGCLAHPAWTHRRRQTLWRATANSPKAYWTLQAERARQAMILTRAGAWWFGAGLLMGTSLQWVLPKGSLPYLDPLSAVGPGWPWVVCGLVFPVTVALLMRRHRRLGRHLETCRSILASLEPQDEEG
jgi:hypothetical protein